MRHGTLANAPWVNGSNTKPNPALYGRLVRTKFAVPLSVSPTGQLVNMLRVAIWTGHGRCPASCPHMRAGGQGESLASEPNSERIPRLNFTIDEVCDNEIAQELKNVIALSPRAELLCNADGFLVEQGV